MSFDFQSTCTGHWDRHRIEQVVVHLLTNALKYAPKGHVYLATSNDLVDACFTISDNGPGIDKQLQQKIFERFERSSTSLNVSGLGLGLFIVKKIVQAHHGRVEVKSDGGKGSSFIVKLPLRPNFLQMEIEHGHD